VSEAADSSGDPMKHSRNVHHVISRIDALLENIIRVPPGVAG
jgi:hypothetical protein